MNFRLTFFVIVCLLGFSFNSKAQSSSDCVGNIPADLIIPTVITPNSDGKNDEFKVVSSKLLTLKVEIFNRWGEKVYTIPAINGIWDGTVFGVVLSSGTYFYNAEYTSSCAASTPIKVGGYFTLLSSN